MSAAPRARLDRWRLGLQAPPVREAPLFRRCACCSWWYVVEQPHTCPPGLTLPGLRPRLPSRLPTR